MRAAVTTKATDKHGPTWTEVEVAGDDAGAMALVMGGASSVRREVVVRNRPEKCHATSREGANLKREGQPTFGPGSLCLLVPLCLVQHIR